MFNSRLLIVSGLMLIGTSASAAVIAEDDFSYADGPLAGNGSAADAGWDGGWFTNFSSTGTMTIDGGTAVASLNARHRTQRVLTVPAGTDGSTLYVGFDYDPGTFFNGVEFYNGGTRNSTIDVQSDGLAFRSINAGSLDLAESTGVDRYVVQFNFGAGNADTAEVFVNGVSVGTSSGTGDLTFDRISIAAFTQNGDTTGGIDLVDNLIIADTFAEAAVPEPSSLALLGLGGLLIARRRRG